MIGQQSPPKASIGADGWDERWRVAGLCLALAAITFAVFGQTLQHGFVNYDDDVYVYNNATVAGGLSLKGLVWVFTHADCNFYHPLTMLSLMVDYQLHGFHAGGYHLTNVLLHTGSAILLFLVLHQMTGALWRSVFVAAVFAVHPLRVESVAWVAERKDVLSGFFFMLALGAYARYARKPNSLARYLMVAVAFVLALLSKPTVVTLPFVLLLLDYWPLQRLELRKLSQLILEKIPLLALAAGACAMTVLAEGKVIVTVAKVSVLSRIGNALVSYVVYLRQMIWPEGLLPYYPLPVEGHPVWMPALCFLLLAAITIVVVVYRRKRRWLLTGWLWYLGMLTPMIGLVQLGGIAHADRFTYLPQIGIYMMLTWLVAEWGAKWRAAQGGLMVAVIGVLMGCAWVQTTYWRDSETLWSHTIDCTTDNALAHYNLGVTFMEKGRPDESIIQYQEALQIKPDYDAAHNNLGLALLHNGNVDEAITHFQRMVKISPDYAEGHYNLGIALRQKGRTEDAITQFREALRINPGYAQAHDNLGNALLHEGKTDEAILQYQEALKIIPNLAKAHNNLGNALLQKGRVDEAIAQFQQALQLSPDDGTARVNLEQALKLRQTGKPVHGSAQTQ